MVLEERVTELEVRMAYQDTVIATLDEVIRDFAARVERLERLAREREHAAGAAPGVPPASDPPDEPPPHY